MSEVTKQLEESGYKKHVADFYKTLMHTDTLYQKRITDQSGVRYFINAWYYDTDGRVFSCDVTANEHQEKLDQYNRIKFYHSNPEDFILLNREYIEEVLNENPKEHL